MRQTAYWHRETPEDIAKAVFSVVDSLESDQKWREESYKRYASYYKDKQVSGFEPGKWRFGNGTSIFGLDDAPLSYNVIRSTTDTVAAKITLQRPLAKFLTSHASVVLQQQARQLERFCWATMSNCDAFVAAGEAFRDCCLYGLGVLKVREEDGRIIVERVHPIDIIVDDAAAMDGKPRSMFQRSYADRETLCALFPEAVDAIEMAQSAAGHDGIDRDLVKVCEAWHLPRGKEKGRHVVCVAHATLLDEEWHTQRFPFAFLRWSNDLAGFHGCGLAEELEGLQVEINETLNKIRANMALLAVPFFLVPVGSEVNEEHLLTNKVARLVRYAGGVPPKVETPPAVHPQIFQYLEQLYARAFEISGISMLSATSQKPAGLYSGLALSTYIDVETQRFSQIARQWEQLFVDLAMRIVDCAKHGTDIKSVRWANRDSFEEIEWSDVDLDEDQFQIQVSPASSLPKTQAGRIESVVNLVQSGVVDRTQAALLLDLPDLDKFNQLNNAPLEDLTAIMEHMLATGDYIEPLEYMDLALGIRLATRFWSRARLAKADDERVELLARWMREASEMLRPQPQFQQGPAPAENASTQAMPPIPPAQAAA